MVSFNTVRNYIILISLLLVSIQGWSNNLRDSIFTARKDSLFIVTSEVNNEEFYFEEPADILEEGAFPSTVNNDSIQRYIDLARTVLDKVRATQNFITNIDEATKFELPVGITKTIGGVTYDIAIHAIRFKPAYAEIDVFMEFEVPQNGQKLTFMARGIKFTKKGGIVGDAKLELLGDYGINFNGDKVQLILKGTTSGQGTYAVMDCDGFRELSIDASVKFSRDLLVPENADGSIGQGNVMTNFKTVMSNWNDLVVQLDLPNFQVNGLKGVGFSVRDAVFDFSDLRNAPAVVFPAGYQSTQMLPDNPNLWRGFYLRQLTISLPPEFQKKGTTTRTSFAAESVLIDNMGVSGKFRGTDLIPLNQGDMNGWAFSLDSLGIELQANQLVEAGFSGGIVIPVGKEDKPFEYSAIINTGGNYLFNVSPSSDMQFPLWGAGKVEIYEASYLDIKIQNGKFLPKANLHGRMAINAKLSEGGQGVELADISFENLEIQSVKPFIKVGSFSFGSEALQQKMAGFPISIQDIGLRNLSDTQVGLDFTLKLNLVGENSGGFAADAGLTVIGAIDPSKGMQSWRYKDINVKEIGVDIDGGAFKMNGRLIFYKNDAMYGDGFNGTVKAEFTPGIKVTATAIFGNVTGMRYWYADAMVNFPSGIPVFTGIGIYGFGGGAYYAMKMDNQGVGSALGKTASGVVYVPDTKAGLGLKAIVSLGSHPKPEAFNADVTFEISFFKGGGVRHIAFGGNGYMVTPGLDVNLDKLKAATGKMAGVVKKMESKMSDVSMGLVKSGGSENSMTEIFGEIGDKAGQKGQISAKVMIDYDFENRVLHGNFEVFVNVAGGIIKGIGAGGRAGWAVLHFAPKEWYVYVGTPDDRVGISLGIGPIRASATSYFMVGTKILDSPPPPSEVSRILRGADVDYMKDLNSIGTGGGFAFGAGLSISTGDLSFLMFYARFDAGAGFDIMLKDYGDLRCKGSSKRIGINGWYANGQAYAYFDGTIGIRVKVFGRKRNVEILNIAAAALLQAQLPNPFWLQGTVGGRFRVLGGLVKGDCKFQVTLGEKCEIEKDQNAILDDIKVIAELTPSNGEQNINVFNNPQAVFNMPVDKEFELVDEGDVRRTFRIKLDHFKLLDGKTSIVGSLEWNDNHDVLAFNSYEILPPKKEIKMLAQVSFEELKNDSWSAVVSDGQRVTEKVEQSFITGEAPDFIPHENVEYSYPVISQTNFYKNESNEGYIKLKKAQPYLFQVGPEWKQKGRFKAADGTISFFDFIYTYSSNTVNFVIPELKTSQAYVYELLNLPAQNALAIDRNVSEETNKVKGENEMLNTEITTKKAEGTIESLQEKSIFSVDFKSSDYSTFSQKLDHFSYSPGWTWAVQTGVNELGTTLNGSEYFEKIEIHREILNSSLIQFEADLSDNYWFQSLVYPLVYEGYPISGSVKLERDHQILGLIPAKSIHIRQTPADIVYRRDATISQPSVSAIVYNLPLEMYRDYLDIQSKCANLSINTGSERINKIITTPFPVLRQGDYKISIRYSLPGLNKITTNKNKTINYSVTHIK